MNRDEKMEEELECHSVQLPNGRKIYNKYQIRHTDGTPLKGKQYFVLRLDSDDPKEAARVSAAMTAYKGNAAGNAAAMRKALIIVYDWILKAGNVYGYPDTEQKRRQLYDMMTKALSAPPRNCDLYNSGDADKDANSAWDCFNGALNIDIQNLSEREHAMLKEFMSAFVWLFSSAKEGANDEQK